MLPTVFRHPLFVVFASIPLLALSLAGNATGACPSPTAAAVVEARYERGRAALEASRDGEHFRTDAYRDAMAHLAFAARNGHVAAQSLYGCTAFGVLFGNHGPVESERADYVDALGFLRSAARAGDRAALSCLPGISGPADAVGEPLSKLPDGWVSEAFRRGDELFASHADCR
ncbi:MAG TPA: hypothetical protein ENI85_17465 [Deltaproteobacteria bacterium]|nr:hypothetical protein [Deltaproteobacteria bacterium]